VNNYKCTYNTNKYLRNDIGTRRSRGIGDMSLFDRFRIPRKYKKKLSERNKLL